MAAGDASPGPTPGPEPDPEGQTSYSIGALAEACGIAPDTLRVWERRYGRPVPQRLPSGHRRYDESQLRWLRRVAEALGLGLRAAEVVTADEAELDRLLARHAQPPAFEPQHLLNLARAWRADEIRTALRESHDSLGLLAFLEQRIAPLLSGVGAAWADGRLGVRHEHHLSEHVEDLLRSLRLEQPLPAAAPKCVLATLEGEDHALGLQMAALICASAGVRPVLLGRAVPVTEIVAAARETGACGVALSVSAAVAGVATDRQLAELRAALPARVVLAVGGSKARGAAGGPGNPRRGLRRGPRGVDWFDAPGFTAFAHWCARLRAD